MENQSYVESVKRTSIVQSFFAQVYGWMFFGLLSTGIVAYYTGTFSGVVKSDLWQSNNVLCVFVCADRVGYDHQQQNQFAECEYGQLSVFCLFSCNRRYTVGNFSYVYAGVHCNDFWDNGRYFWRNSSFWICH